VHFFWKKNGSLLQEGRELELISISPEDSGNYSCMVRNSIGQTSSKALRLQVLCECSKELEVDSIKQQVAGDRHRSPDLVSPCRCTPEAACVH
jgi:hypothetical protein